MSASTAVKHGRALPSATGMKSPACAMSAHSPRVFSATVLPPAFGPVMASPRCPGRSSRSTGTTARPLRRRRGWRAASSRTWSPPRRRARAVVQAGERGRGAERVGVRQRDLERLQRRRRVANPRGQLGADAAFLGLLGLGGEEQAVVELDGEQGFDEDRLVGLGAVLDHALEGPRGGGADGHDVASVPHRDVLVADDAGLRGIAHHGQELRFEPHPQVARGASRRRERRACVLADLAALVEHRGERGFDVGRLGQAVGHRGETREAVGIASQMVAHLPCHQQEVPHLDQPARLQRGARRRRLLEGRTETRDVAGGQRAGLATERHQLGQGVEAALCLGAVGRRPQRSHRVPPRVGAGEGGDGLEGTRKLEGVEVAGAHGDDPIGSDIPGERCADARLLTVGGGPVYQSEPSHRCSQTAAMPQAGARPTHLSERQYTSPVAPPPSGPCRPHAVAVVSCRVAGLVTW